MDTGNPFITGSSQAPKQPETPKPPITSRKFWRVLAPILFFILIIGIGVIGYYLYSNVAVRPIALTSYRSDQYSMVVPASYTLNIEDETAVFTDMSVGDQEGSEVRVQRLYALVGDRQEYVDTLNDTVSEKMITDYGLSLEPAQTLANVRAQHDSETEGQEYWQVRAEVQESGRAVATITIRLRMSASDLYAVSVISRSSDAILDAKAEEIVSSFMPL